MAVIKRMNTPPIFESPFHETSISPRRQTIRAVILTMSGKGGGACVAAYDLSEKKFVRFVGDSKTAAEIPFSELRGISEFDVVEAESIGVCPVGPQYENILIQRHGLKRIGRYSGTIEDIRSEIRYNDNRSIADTTDDRLWSVEDFKHSLEIINVRDLTLHRIKKRDGSYATRAGFIYNGKSHDNYRVTDFKYDLRTGDVLNKSIPYADVVLSIPISPYITASGVNMGYFKFVASVFPVDCPHKNEYALPVRSAAPKTAESDGRQRLRDMVDGTRRNSYEPWTELEDELLSLELSKGMTLKEMAVSHQRSYGAIRSRLIKLGLSE